MNRRQFWIVNYLVIGGIVLVSVFLFWIGRGLWDWQWTQHTTWTDKDGITWNRTHHSEPSVFFKVLTAGGLFFAWSLALALVLNEWCVEHVSKWLEGRGWRREASKLSKEARRAEARKQADQARLRELALVAVENEVYTAIAENRPVNSDTAALLRSVQP